MCVCCDLTQYHFWSQNKANIVWCFAKKKTKNEKRFGKEVLNRRAPKRNSWKEYYMAALTCIFDGTDTSTGAAASPACALCEYAYISILLFFLFAVVFSGQSVDWETSRCAFLATRSIMEITERFGSAIRRRKGKRKIDWVLSLFSFSLYACSCISVALFTAQNTSLLNALEPIVSSVGRPATADVRVW